MTQGKSLIFISSNEHLSSLNMVLEGLNQNTLVVLGEEVSADIPVDLKDKIIFKDFRRYETVEHNAKTCYDEAWQLIKRWGSLRIDEKNSFEDLTRYKNICLWRINDVILFLYYLEDMVYYIKIVSSILEQERPAQLILVGSKFKTIEKIFFEIAKQKGIQILHKPAQRVAQVVFPIFPVVLERSYYLPRLEIRVCLPLQLYIWGLILKNSIRGILGKMYNLRSKTSPIKKHRNIVFYSSIKKTLDSIIPLVRELQKDIKNRVLVIDWFWNSGDAIDTLRKENIPHRVFDGYITLGICKSLWQKSQDFLRNWRLIENNQSFQRQFTYKGLFMWNLLSDYLKELFLRHFVKMSIFFEVAQRIIDTERPDIIVVTNEKEYIARLSVLAAKFKNVPTLAIQRTAFSEYDVDIGGPLYTDKMVVDGEFIYQIFVKRGAEPEKIIIAGNPRYDIIKHIDIFSARERLYKKLALSRDKKLLLLTSMFLNPTYRLWDKKELLRTVFSAIKRFPNCHLVVKLHPGETSDQLYQNIIKEVGIKNISIVKDLDTFELIASCWVLITNHSTTGVEAILMDKPFVFVNLSKVQPDWMPSYVESGAALGVYREEDMEETIKNILSNEVIQEKLRMGRRKFISCYIQDFDGQASSRIAKIVMEMAHKLGGNE